MSPPDRFPIVRKILARIWLQAVILALFLSVHVLFDFIPEIKNYPVIHKVVGFLTVWIGAWLASRVLSVLREMPAVSNRLAPNLRLLIFGFFQLLIYALGFLIALDSVGVSITPLLASLGVGSLAVGLALQDTLGNLFSGFYLYLDRPIAPGDWIRTESGIEGQVSRIGWRSTHVIIGNENTVVIPNSKLSTSNITNFNLPTRETTLTIPLSVAYSSDLEVVEKTLVEAAKEFILSNRDFFTAAAPFVRYTRFGESGVEAVVSLQLQNFSDLAVVRHEVMKVIKLKLDSAKIEMPYPQRTVHLVAEKGI